METSATEARRFLLVGHQGSNNRGCEALVRTTVDVLRQIFPDSSITLASMYPENDLPLLDIDHLEIIPGISCLTALHHSGDQNQGQLWSIRKLASEILPHGLVKRLGRGRSGRSRIGPALPRPNTESWRGQAACPDDGAGPVF